MTNGTIITVVGNLTDDPELKFTPSGAAVANFRVASTPRTFDRTSNEWRDGEPMFLNCSVWRQQAENAAESLRKGMRVVVQGKLKARTYETREGEKRTVFEIDVEEVGPSLKYATATVDRQTRAAAGGGSASAGSRGGWGDDRGGSSRSRGGDSRGGDSRGGDSRGGRGEDPWATVGGGRGNSDDPWNPSGRDQGDEPPF